MSRPFFVYVQGAFANRQSGQVLEEHPSKRFKVIQNIHLADVVVWTGGADINPALYGSKTLPGTGFSESRDKDDVRAITISRDKVLIGICRGAQLLNCIPNMGTLWQDVDRHGQYHEVEDYVTGKTWTVNSLHHQMMRPTPDAVIVAGCKQATRKDTYEEAWFRNNPDRDEYKKYEVDPEVVWYPRTKSLLFQGHPEFGHPETTEYFHELVTRYVLPQLEDKISPSDYATAL